MGITNGMKKILGILVFAGFSGCIPQPDIGDLVRYMVVETAYAVEGPNGEDNVFNTYTNFLLRADTLGFVSTYSRDSILLQSGQIDFVQPVIAKVASNAEARGFNRVEADGNPDFALKIVVLENFSFFQTVSYPGYYSGYYGYYGGYYGPIVNTYSSNFVTLVIEAVDIKNYANNEGKYVVVWSAYIGDLLTTDDRKNKLLQAVDQAFIQSPYFSKN